MTTQRYDASDFTSLSISHAFEVTLQKGDIYSVILEYPADCAGYISVAKQKATLFVGLKNKTPRKYLNGRHTFRATIVMPEVYGIYLSGASKLTATEPFQMNMRPFEARLSGASRIIDLSVEGPSVDFDLSGASRAEVNVNSAEVDVDLSGASRITITGTVGELSLDLTGASSANARNVNAAIVDVDASGASKASVFVERELKVDLSGASRCDYIGPENLMLKVDSITGASSLKKVK